MGGRPGRSAAYTKRRRRREGGLGAAEAGDGEEPRRRVPLGGGMPPARALRGGGGIRAHPLRRPCRGGGAVRRNRRLPPLPHTPTPPPAAAGEAAHNGGGGVAIPRAGGGRLLLLLLFPAGLPLLLFPWLVLGGRPCWARGLFFSLFLSRHNTRRVGFCFASPEKCPFRPFLRGVKGGCVCESLPTPWQGEGPPRPARSPPSQSRSPSLAEGSGAARPPPARGGGLCLPRRSLLPSLASSGDRRGLRAGSPRPPWKGLFPSTAEEVERGTVSFHLFP